MARTRTEALTPTETSKDFGAVFTPAHIAQCLARWAIHSPENVVLDPGAGQGAFLLAAFERLKELGASTEVACQQLWGVELQEEHFERLTENVRASTSTTFPHLHHANLFQEEFPPLDPIIGNPPYVIRARMADINEIAQRVALRMQYSVKLRGQADLYCYFIMYAASFLKEGGRMALIVSDAWLDADYGVELKEFLLQNFRVEALISFDRRVFPAALVKSLVLLAVRTKQSKANAPVRFRRVKQPSSLDTLFTHLETDSSFDDGSVKVVLEPQGTLNPRQYWGIYFKQPDLYFKLSTHPLRRMSLLLTQITPMSLGRASGPPEGGQRCNLWTHWRKRRRVEDAQEKLWRLSKARMCSPPDARRCTSGYLLIGVCRRRGKRFVPRNMSQ
jgi:tRNA1(Val) A37 N6-methylase TrmN6